MEPIDIAVFNVGAYEPRWFMAQSHLNPAETVQAFQELNARKLMIMHWGTFQLGDEPVHFPPRHMRNEMKQAGLLHRLVDWQLRRHRGRVRTAFSLCPWLYLPGRFMLKKGW